SVESKGLTYEICAPASPRRRLIPSGRAERPVSGSPRVPCHGVAGIVAGARPEPTLALSPRSAYKARTPAMSAAGRLKTRVVSRTGSVRVRARLLLGEGRRDWSARARTSPLTG